MQQRVDFGARPHIKQGQHGEGGVVGQRGRQREVLRRVCADATVVLLDLGAHGSSPAAKERADISLLQTMMPCTVLGKRSQCADPTAGKRVGAQLAVKAQQQLAQLERSPHLAVVTTLCRLSVL
jgi:hypothetical protein